MRLIILGITFLFFFCEKPTGQGKENSSKNAEIQDEIIVGASRLKEYLPLLEGKNIALAVNQTSLVGEQHLVDTLISLGINVQKVFAPEHGFRGTADAGELVENSIDKKTGVQIISLYGSNKKPTAQQLQDIDIIIFDIQDVGVRYYTYISTLHYLMEAAAENNKKILIFDRPNPHGSYFDGPVLDISLKSFVGMHPIPLVHGLTVGELALMINAEGWLNGGLKSNLQVIKMANYDHSKVYSLPVKPSPNLPNDLSIALYPSLGLFEGTTISVGRGTHHPFQQIGHPMLEKKFSYAFIPKSIEGMSKYPPHENEKVYGIDLKTQAPDYRFTLKYIITMYENFPDKNEFFLNNNFFEKLAGTEQLRDQIKAGLTEKEIRQTWNKELEAYGKMREKYLLYDKE